MGAEVVYIFIADLSMAVGRVSKKLGNTCISLLKFT